jgi:hypothetical protein
VADEVMLLLLWEAVTLVLVLVVLSLHCNIGSQHFS